jgi:hypothetical protein
MQKMEADSLAELVRMAAQLKVPLPSARRRGNVDMQCFHLRPVEYSKTRIAAYRGGSEALIDKLRKQQHKH